jgi:hypothetical protein
MADRQLKSIFTGGPQLPACKNDDFYWPLALAVTKNATINWFTTATIELLCTSGGEQAEREAWDSTSWAQRRRRTSYRGSIQTRVGGAQKRRRARELELQGGEGCHGGELEEAQPASSAR